MGSENVSHLPAFLTPFGPLSQVAVMYAGLRRDPLVEQGELRQ